MSANSQLHLHPDAIRHNLTALRSYLKSHITSQHQPRIWAVVKADAYGHGLKGMLPGLRNADGLAIANLDDAYMCRAAGWTGPILYMVRNDDIGNLNDPRLAPLHIVVSTSHQITRLEALPGFNDLHIWLRYAGALNHAGLKATDYRQAYQRLLLLLQHKKITGLGHLQHYAHAEDTRQLSRERQQLATLIKGLPGPVCSENSAAALNGPGFATTTAWVRSGIALYGINPLTHPPGITLQPAMTLRAPIYAIQHLEPNESLGYGGSFRAPRAMRVGLVRCGYADGYPRIVAPACPCSVAGKSAALVGRVSMDTLSIDITAHPDIGTGDMVSLWGEHGISVEQIAHAANTIAAQLLTAISAHVPRYYPGDHGYQAPGP